LPTLNTTKKLNVKVVDVSVSKRGYKVSYVISSVNNVKYNVTYVPYSQYTSILMLDFMLGRTEKSSEIQDLLISSIRKDLEMYEEELLLISTRNKVHDSEIDENKNMGIVPKRTGELTEGSIKSSKVFSQGTLVNENIKAYRESSLGVVDGESEGAHRVDTGKELQVIRNVSLSRNFVKQLESVDPNLVFFRENESGLVLDYKMGEGVRNSTGNLVVSKQEKQGVRPNIFQGVSENLFSKALRDYIKQGDVGPRILESIRAQQKGKAHISSSLGNSIRANRKGYMSVLTDFRKAFRPYEHLMHVLNRLGTSTRLMNKGFGTISYNMSGFRSESKGKAFITKGSSAVRSESKSKMYLSDYLTKQFWGKMKARQYPTVLQMLLDGRKNYNGKFYISKVLNSIRNVDKGKLDLAYELGSIRNIDKGKLNLEYGYIMDRLNFKGSVSLNDIISAINLKFYVRNEIRYMTIYYSLFTSDRLNEKSVLVHETPSTAERLVLKNMSVLQEEGQFKRHSESQLYLPGYLVEGERENSHGLYLPSYLVGGERESSHGLDIAELNLFDHLKIPKYLDVVQELQSERVTETGLYIPYESKWGDKHSVRDLIVINDKTGERASSLTKELLIDYMVSATRNNKRFNMELLTEYLLGTWHRSYMDFTQHDGMLMDDSLLGDMVKDFFEIIDVLEGAYRYRDLEGYQLEEHIEGIKSRISSMVDNDFIVSTKVDERDGILLFNEVEGVKEKRKAIKVEEQPQAYEDLRPVNFDDIENPYGFVESKHAVGSLEEILGNRAKAYGEINDARMSLGGRDDIHGNINDPDVKLGGRDDIHGIVNEPDAKLGGRDDIHGNINDPDVKLGGRDDIHGQVNDPTPIIGNTPERYGVTIKDEETIGESVNKDGYIAEENFLLKSNSEKVTDLLTDYLFATDDDHRATVIDELLPFIREKYSNFLIDEYMALADKGKNEGLVVPENITAEQFKNALLETLPEAEDDLEAQSFMYDYQNDLLNYGMDIEDWDDNIGFHIPKGYDPHDPYNAYHPWNNDYNTAELTQLFDWIEFREGNWDIDREKGTFESLDDVEVINGLYKNSFVADEYTFEFDVKVHDSNLDHAVGVTFKYVDEDNFYYFLMSGGDQDGSLRMNDTMQLFRMVDGVEYRMSSPMAPFKWELGNWYTLRVEVRNARTKVWVDGQLQYDFID